MADDLGSNPMAIDTASATAKTLQDGTTTMRLCISKMVWSAPSTDDHECEVQDGSGNRIYKFDPAISPYNQSIDFGSQGIKFTGLTVPTLDSGTLYIYLK